MMERRIDEQGLNPRPTFGPLRCAYKSAKGPGQFFSIFFYPRHLIRFGQILVGKSELTIVRYVLTRTYRDVRLVRTCHGRWYSPTISSLLEL